MDNTSVNVASSLPDPLSDVETKLKTLAPNLMSEWGTPLSVLRSMFDIRKYTLLQGSSFLQSGKVATFGLVAYETTTSNFVALVLHHSFEQPKPGKVAKIKQADITSILSTISELPRVVAETILRLPPLDRVSYAIYEKALLAFRDPSYMFTDLILVANKEYTSGEAGAAKIAKQAQYTDMMWPFQLEELGFNKYTHQLQPKDIYVLTEKEEDEFLKVRKIKKSQLPQGFNMDPLFKFIGVKEDRIVRSISDNNLPATINSIRTSWRVIKNGKMPPRPKFL